jgi:uncharacterized protein YjiK
LRLRWYHGLLLALAIAAIVAKVLHWDDRGELWVHEMFESPAERQQSIWLPDYQAVIDGKLLPGMEKDEASDLTYSAETKTLFSVMGKNPFLVELSLQTCCARCHWLAGAIRRRSPACPTVGWRSLMSASIRSPSSASTRKPGS